MANQKPEWTEFQGGEIMVLDCAMILIERIRQGTWEGGYKIRFGLREGKQYHWNIEEARREAIELAKNALQNCARQLEEL